MEHRNVSKGFVVECCVYGVEYQLLCLAVVGSGPFLFPCVQCLAW